MTSIMCPLEDHFPRDKGLHSVMVMQLGVSVLLHMRTMVPLIRDGFEIRHVFDRENTDYTNIIASPKSVRVHSRGILPVSCHGNRMRVVYS